MPSLSGVPPAERPRERLWSLGASALTATELVAILLGTGQGGANALGLAASLVSGGGGSLRGIAARPAAELLRIPGVGPTKAARILAAFELADRVAREARPPTVTISQPTDVVALLAPRLRDLKVEEFHLLALDAQSHVLRDVMITRGLLNTSLVHPREVFRAAIVEAAAGIIVVHNHPSGDPTPSPDDMAVTRQLAAAGRLLDLPLYDHVVIGADRHVSFAAQGLL